MPNYLPGATVDFSSPLHQVASKQIKISNPSLKNIYYEAIIVGPNKESFSLPKGKELPISAKSFANLSIDFNANNLKPGNAYLILVGKKNMSLPAETLVFCLSTCVDELTAKTYKTKQKNIKIQSPLYKPIDTMIEVENPYDQAGEFKVNIIESDNKNGSIYNPYLPESHTEQNQQLSMKKSLNVLNDYSKTSVESIRSQKSQKLRNSVDKFKREEEHLKDFEILSSFYTKTESIYLDARGKSHLNINYLPLQMIKHTAIVLFTNEKLGEFLYYLEGSAHLPEPTKVIVDEKLLEPARIKFIKSSRFENRTLTFRSFVGDKCEIKLLVPVCNLEKENAIIMATEMRMSELELKRRQVHGVLSSKSLLESIERLTLNKQQPLPEPSQHSLKNKKPNTENNINYAIQAKNAPFLNVQNSLLIKSDEIKSDENFVPLMIRFNPERQGTFNATLELKYLPNDVRVIPLEFRVTESSVSDSNVAFLKFNSCIFDSVTQPIPIKNNSEIACNYQVEFIPNKSLVFRGVNKFSIKPKDVYVYDLKFTPNAEDKFETELRFNNITEGTQIKYMLTGIGERGPPIGEIKLETKVGQTTHHEIMIPNKSNKKICFYVFSSSSFIKGPDKIMVLPNRKEPYIFDIQPSQRGDYKGVITFKPGEWPIKDIDSDGEEMCVQEEKEKPQQFTLWFSYDIKVQPPPYQSSVELEVNSQDTATLSIPLSNPYNKKMEFRVLKNGPYLYGEDLIEIKAKEKYNYELKFSPIQVGKFRGSLIFLNEETGEFWYDLRLISSDPLPIQTDIVEAEVGRYTMQTLKIKNPLNEPVTFRVLISNTNNFALEKKQHEKFTLEPNTSIDVNVIFTPSTIGLVDHFGLISFCSEKIGNIIYELRGAGIEPDTQDPINITSEICTSQMCTINLRNPTDSAIYCDIVLYDDKNRKVEVNNDKSAFNILLTKFENIHVSPKAVLDIPIVFTPNELKLYTVFLEITARREARMNWIEQDSNKKIEKLKWIYPIRAYSVINAYNKSNPFLLECMVKQRLEKRMDIILANVTTYSSGLDRGSLKMRSVTPKKAGLFVDNLSSSSSASLSSSEENNLIRSESSKSLVIVGDTNMLASEFVYTLHFNGTLEQCELAKNSLAIKLIRVVRDKSSGLVTLVFDVILCPSKSFMIDGCVQIETALGGIWRYPIKIVSIEPPPDDTIILEAYRLNKESIIGFRLTSKTNQAVPFKAQFLPTGDQVFTITPSSGELLPEDEDGTLIKVAFIPPAYGKVYQNQLIITTPMNQWKYLVKGVTPEYVKPRGQSALPRHDSKIRKYGSKKRNYLIENTYIISTAASSPIKGASLMPMRYSNLP